MASVLASHRLPDPHAGWRVLAAYGEPFMLRREGNVLRAYLEFSEWHRPDLADPEASMQVLFEDVASPCASSTIDVLPRWVGFWSYDFLAAHMGLRLQAPRDVAVPDGLFGRPLARLTLSDTQTLIEAVDACRVKALAALTSASERDYKQAPVSPFRCNLDFETYRDIFHCAREHILDGDTYQIKISQRYFSEGARDPLATFRKLDARNPSPEAFLLCVDDFALVSCSPETVINLREGVLETRPIGGTWERRGDVSCEAAQEAFSSNDKECSEHNMLVDLERNDLARVCLSGTVKVARYRELERYAHLYHTVSTIRGRLRGDVRRADIVRALLPGGSITGCPKWRTMELIDRYEPSARGVYTGAFGSIETVGAMRFNLIIRTLLMRSEGVYAQAGGGIVVDSTPEYEYNENAIKARALLEACS